MPESGDQKSKVIDATLVMDSRGRLTPVRNQAFAAGWSRLYHAGHYYLDLSLKAEQKQQVLWGRVLPSTVEMHLEGQVRLQASAGGKPRLATLTESGEFRLVFDTSGQHELLIELPGVTVRVQGLELN